MAVRLVTTNRIELTVMRVTGHKYDMRGCCIIHTILLTTNGTWLSNILPDWHQLLWWLMMLYVPVGEQQSWYATSNIMSWEKNVCIWILEYPSRQPKIVSRISCYYQPFSNQVSWHFSSLEVSICTVWALWIGLSVAECTLYHLLMWWWWRA